MMANFGWLMYNNDCFKNNPSSQMRAERCYFGGEEV